jgi:hypothetical protein
MLSSVATSRCQKDTTFSKRLIHNGEQAEGRTEMVRTFSPFFAVRSGNLATGERTRRRRLFARTWSAPRQRQGCLAGALRVLYGAAHTCTVQSMEPEAMRLPSGDHATAKTAVACPR